MRISKMIKSFLQVLVYLFLGIVLWFGICIYVICTIPIYLYRFFVTHILVKCFFPNIGALITIKGQGCATDFIGRNLSYSYRSSLVVINTFTGTICPKNLKDLFLRRCINKKDEEGNPIFPEMKQYIHPFMGFMFWKNDEDFKLENHITLHDIGTDSTNASSESFICNLREALLGQRFTKKRSPWELHLVHNYRNSLVSDETMSVVIFLIHHSVADGPSIVNLLGEITFDQEVESLNSIIPRSKNRKCVGLACIFSFIPNLLRLVYDSGYLTMLYFQRSNIPWLVPDSQKSRFLSETTKQFPVDKIKLIKNKFNVGFTTVLLSCLSAGISKCMHDDKLEAHEDIEKMPVFIPIPKWKSTKKLGFLGTYTLVDLPLQHNFDPVQRLLTCHKELLFARRSTIPFLVTILAHLFLSNVTLITRYIGRNRFIPTCLSPFPLPNNEGVYNGMNKLLSVEFFSGGHLGNCGVVFHVPSFRNELKICVTSEGKLLNRDSLKKLVDRIENEIEILLGCSPDFEQSV